MRQVGQIKRAPRVAACHRATLVDSDGGERSVVIRDLSSSGFRVQLGETLLIGERVTLVADRYGDMPARIRWAFDGEAGGEFLEPANL